MGTLYTCVSEIGKKDIIILNSKYSRKELAEKLRDTNSSDRLGTILSEGINLEKRLRVKCHADGVITTQQSGSMSYFYKGDKVTVYPDGVYSIKPSVLRSFFHFCTKH
jgi:hypothetical protein